MADSGWFKKLAALGMVALLVAIVTAAIVQFFGGFTTTVPVTINTARTGLVMDPDAKVKMRGVEVGRVASIDIRADGATIKLAMQPDKMHLIPANSAVDIRSTTIFGAKYVNFLPPAEPSKQALAANSTITADSVTVEFNTLFEHLTQVLDRLEPQKINATLAALSTAVQGRGEQIGELISQSDEYLKKFNPILPVLQRDFAQTADVTNLYADVSPDLLKVVANVTGTSQTLTQEKDNFEQLLLSVIGLDANATSVLAQNERAIDTSLHYLRPTSDLLREYAPGLSCLIKGMDAALPLAEAIFGGGQEGVALNAGFMYGPKPYVAPRDLPKVNASGGPHCFGLPNPGRGVHAPYLVSDTGNEPYVPSTQLSLNAPKILQLLLGDPGGN